MFREFLYLFAICGLSTCYHEFGEMNYPCIRHLVTGFFTGVELIVDINTYGRNQSELVFTHRFEVPSRSLSLFEVRGLNQEFLSYVVFQLHTFYYNVSLTLEKNASASDRRNGTNIGIILEPGQFSQMVYLQNENYDDVQCMVAVVVYNQSSPVVAGCSTGSGLKENPTLSLNETENFIIVETPLAKLPKKQCDDNDTELLEYSTYYLYLEQMNFAQNIYFDGIKSLMFNNVHRNGYQVRIKFQSSCRHAYHKFNFRPSKFIRHQSDTSKGYQERESYSTVWSRTVTVSEHFTFQSPRIPVQPTHGTPTAAMSAC